MIGRHEARLQLHRLGHAGTSAPLRARLSRVRSARGQRKRGPDGLARLIGANRARVLRLLAEPPSTSQLAALTGLPLGAVGNHLRVLLEAGTVLRRCAGREVLYWRPSLSDALAASGR